MEAEKLRAQVQQLDDRLESAREDYQYAKIQLADIEGAIAANQERLDRSERDLKVAYERLNSRVRNIYQNGRVGLLDALLGAESFNDFVNRIHLLTLVGAEDSDVLEQVETYRDEVAARRVKLAADQTRQKELVAETAAASAEVEKKLAERKRLLAGKEQQVAQLEREEEARQRKLAEQAAEAARLAAQRARQQSVSTKPSSAVKTKTAAPSRNVPASAFGNPVVEVAMRYVGVPYVWGGASPSGFDCSGLVQYAFGQLGVSLPHSSRALFDVGVAVAREDLRPGDLVFFGSPIHHVGIYVGGGNMVHAPYTGANVRVNSISRSNYTGARRIL
ncbi:MAG: C40 family peptidase [Thermoleophilia bacterium]